MQKGSINIIILIILYSVPAGGVFGQTYRSRRTHFQDTIYTLPGTQLVELSEKINYKQCDTTDLYLYLLRPNGIRKQLPVIIYFFGGGWSTGNVADILPTAAWFRDHGMVAIAADYRTRTKYGTSPLEAISDAKSAVRYVRSHAHALGIDPKKIIVAGGSAGGHIAACTVLEGGDEVGEDLKVSSKPNALVLHNPVLGIGFGRLFFDAHPEFSPVLQVKTRWPPTVLSCGTVDKTTPFAGAQQFQQLMTAAGNTCVLIPVKNAGHSCDWPVSNPNFLPTIRQMADFLADIRLINP